MAPKEYSVSFVPKHSDNLANNPTYRSKETAPNLPAKPLQTSPAPAMWHFQA